MINHFGSMLLLVWTQNDRISKDEVGIMIVIIKIVSLTIESPNKETLVLYVPLFMSASIKQTEYKLNHFEYHISLDTKTSITCFS